MDIQTGGGEFVKPWRIGTSVGKRIFERVGRLAGRVQETRPLAADVLESDDEYLVVFDAPGATQSDVQVRYVDGDVLVRIDRFREFHEGFEMRFPGRGLSFDGRVELPDDADAEAASATLSATGTLNIRIPRSAAVTTDDSDPVESVDELDG